MSEHIPFDPCLTMIWASTMAALNTASAIERMKADGERLAATYAYQKQKGEFLIALHDRLRKPSQ